MPGRLGHASGVHAVALEPAAILGEVRPRRPDQQRPQAEAAKAKRDIGGHSPAPDVQRVHEEGQRDLVELIRDKLLDETAGKGHEMVGGNRPGHGYAHASSPS